MSTMNREMASVARQEPEILRSVANARIDWVLNHPHMSDWLKAALRSARELDPVAVQNDIEMLRNLFALRATAEVDLMLSRTAPPEADVAANLMPE